jgi:Acyl dehydratase
MNGHVEIHSIGELSVGDEFSFTQIITESMVDAFAALTGDVSPLHMHADFAKDRGFEGRVVHGLLLGGLVSRLIGVHCPGESALLHSMQLKFTAPAYLDDKLLVSATIDHVSTESNVLTLKASIKRLQDNKILCSAKVQVGFTQSTFSEG